MIKLQTMCERQISNHVNFVRKLKYNSIQTYLFNHLSYQLFICQIYLSDMLVTLMIVETIRKKLYKLIIFQKIYYIHVLLNTMYTSIFAYA